MCRQPLGEYLPCKSATNSKCFREFLLKTTQAFQSVSHWFNQHHFAWRLKRVRCFRKCEILNESQCESNLFRVSKDQNNLASYSNPASRWLFNFQNRHFYPPVEMLNFEFGSCSMIKWSKPLQRTSTRLKGKQLNPFPDFECKTKNYFLQNFASSSYILHLEEETETITF